jgi:hypothetical protein
LGISVRTLRNKLNEYGVPAKYSDASDASDSTATRKHIKETA